MPTTFDETFKNHAVHSQLDRAAEKLEEVDTEDLAKDDKDKINRLKMIVAALHDWMDRTEPAFVATSTLDNLNSYLSEVTSQITNFISNGALGHLQSAISQIDPILTIWHQLYSPRKTSDLQGIRQSVSTFRNALEQELEKGKDTIDDRIIEVMDQAANLDEQLVTLKTKFEDTELEISSQKKRLDDAIAEFQSQFSKSQETNRKEHERRKQAMDQAEAKRKESFAALMKQGSEQINNTERDFKNKGDEFLTRLADYQKSIDTMLGIVSEKVIINDYIKRASQENKRSIFWLSASGVLFMGFIAWALYVFYTVLQDDSVSYPRIVSKLAVTAVIGLVAKWTTKQASLHREEERRSQRLALALATISPYLKDMDTERQNEIKGRLSDRLFGRIDDLSSKQKAEDSEEAFSVIKLLTDVIRDITSKGK